MSFCVVREMNLGGKWQFDVARVAKVLRKDDGYGTLRAAVRYHSNIADGNFERFIRTEDIFATLQEAQAHAEQLRKAGAQ